MTKEEVYKKLDLILETPKSKNFIGHLIKAYIPIENVTKVYDKPKDSMVCVLTNDPLISASEIMADIQKEEFKNDFMDHLKSIFDSSKLKTENPISNLISDKKLAFTGKDTDTYMSYNSVQDFYDWVLSKQLNGDKHINWLLNQEVNKKIQPNKTNIKETTVGSFKLGELESFKKLREKFKN